MRSLDEFEKKIGYKFKNRNLLITALTHSSYATRAAAATRAMSDWNSSAIPFWGLSRRNTCAKRSRIFPKAS